MKKILFILISISVSLTSIAIPISRRITDLEHKVASLASNEVEQWNAIKKLDEQITCMEQKALKKIQAQCPGNRDNLYYSTQVNRNDDYENNEENEDDDSSEYMYEM